MMLPVWKLFTHLKCQIKNKNKSVQEKQKKKELQYPDYITVHTLKLLSYWFMFWFQRHIWNQLEYTQLARNKIKLTKLKFPDFYIC